MAIPDKKPDEDKKQFVSRCMSSEAMKKEYPDISQRSSICLATIRKSKASLIENIQLELLNNNAVWDDEWDEYTLEIVAYDIFDENDKLIAAEKKGKKVTLNKPVRTPGGPKKFSVYVKNEKGNVVKVNFGDPNMKIKKNIPERRKSFRARHKCDTPGPKWKARYWSCKNW